MKHINCLCIATLFALGTSCSSHLHAQDHELPEQEIEIVESETATTEKCGCNTNVLPEATQNEETEAYPQESVRTGDILEADALNENDVITETTHVAPHVCEQPQVDETAKIMLAQTQQHNIATHTTANAQDQQQSTLEADFDTMVDELVQSGALDDESATLEAQPKWKMLIARVGSYALALGLKSKEVALSILTQIKETASYYVSGTKKAPTKKR